MTPLNDPGRHVIITCYSKVVYNNFLKVVPLKPQIKWNTHVENKREYYIEMILPDNNIAVLVGTKLALLLEDDIKNGVVEVTFRRLDS